MTSSVDFQHSFCSFSNNDETGFRTNLTFGTCGGTFGSAEGGLTWIGSVWMGTGGTGFDWLVDRPGLNCISSSKSIEVSVTGDSADSAISYINSIVKKIRFIT